MRRLTSIKKICENNFHICNSQPTRKKYIRNYTVRVEVKRPQNTKANVSEPKALKLINHILKDWNKCIKSYSQNLIQNKLTLFQNLSYVVLILKRSSSLEAFMRSRYNDNKKEYQLRESKKISKISLIYGHFWRVNKLIHSKTITVQYNNYCS